MSSPSSPTRRSRPPPPPLPPQRSLEIPGTAIIKYIDVQPPSYAPATTPTIALIHGSPGSYKDFRYLVPLLQSHARVVVLNLPGFDDSVVTDDANRFEHVTALGMARIAYAALAQICHGARHVFLVGHSFGGHTTINVAYMNLRHHQLSLRGIALLSSAGTRPQGTSRPISMNTVAMMIRSKLPLVSRTGQALARSMYTSAGFKDNMPRQHFASAMVRCMTTNYARIGAQCRAIAHVPAFVAWTRDDHLIEEEIFVDLSDAVGPGPRFAFDTGSHFVQRTKATVLGPALMHWIEQVAAGNSGSGSRRDGGGHTHAPDAASVSRHETAGDVTPRAKL